MRTKAGADARLRLVAGLLQLWLGFWLLAAWLVSAPAWLILLLAAASVALVLVSRLRWRRS